MKRPKIYDQFETALQSIKAIEKDHPKEAEYLYFRLLDAILELIRYELGFQKQ